MIFVSGLVFFLKYVKQSFLTIQVDLSSSELQLEPTGCGSESRHIDDGNVFHGSELCARDTDDHFSHSYGRERFSCANPPLCTPWNLREE